jgi:nucleoside-diphosphate-sugar epimerase
VLGVDYVFHLAGATTAPSRQKFFEWNAEGTRRLAEAVSEVNPGLKRFVFVSSLAAGGPARGTEIRRETDPDQPVSAYGESKKAGEEALLEFRARFPISIVRPPMVYGPRDQATLVIFRTAARGLYPSLPTSGSPDRKKHYSTIHVSDLVRGIVQAATVDPLQVDSGEIFYLAHESTDSYDEIMEWVAEKLKKPLVRVKVPKWALVSAAHVSGWFGRFAKKPPHLNPDKLNEILADYWTCSPEKAKVKLGFHAEYDMRKGMSHALDWYVKNGWL